MIIDNFLHGVFDELIERFELLTNKTFFLKERIDNSPVVLLTDRLIVIDIVLFFVLIIFWGRLLSVIVIRIVSEAIVEGLGCKRIVVC